MDNTEQEMPLYRSRSTVRALQIALVEPQDDGTTRLTFTAPGYAPRLIGHNLTRSLIVVPGDYFVQRNSEDTESGFYLMPERMFEADFDRAPKPKAAKDSKPAEG